MSFKLLLDGDVPGFRHYQPIAAKPLKRSFEDSDEEPAYFTRSSLGSYQSTLGELSPYPESGESPIRFLLRLLISSASFGKIVDGVIDDLPEAPDGTTQPAVNYYMELPVVRKLDWRTDAHGQAMRRELSNTRTLVAGYVQTRGQIAENPCTFCAQAKGVWQHCVVGSDAREDKPMTEACANCRFSQRSLCSLRENPFRRG